MKNIKEHKRLEGYRKHENNWKLWGPYLSDRAWGTVREDYSADGDAWRYFPHDHARSRTYRWNEDGIAGISDRNQYLCFALALWNGRDAILKERMFGLSGHEGNHGEDLKEYYFYLDNTPCHSYMKMLYKYPQNAFPYEQLIKENRSRGYHQPEYELLDTGIFDADEYFDVFIEYAKADEKDICIQISVHNRGQSPAICYLLPTLWFRNTWSWGYTEGPMGDIPWKPHLFLKNAHTIEADHPALGSYYLYIEEDADCVFTENDTNKERLFGVKNASPYVKDAFHTYLIDQNGESINPSQEGTKAAAIHAMTVRPDHPAIIRLRLSKKELESPFDDFETTFAEAKEDAEAFYEDLYNEKISDEEKKIIRQAFASLLWNKQLYYFNVNQWLEGDPCGPKPPEERKGIRNLSWEHLINFDVISMPDKWEYPWYASWDLAFHCITLAIVDGDFAKRQLTLMMREWYMHPNGQFPAYEWNFDDVNPPVFAWAALRVFQYDAISSGKPDREFLEGIFHKLLLNFTWWVNRKDETGRNVFQGGFLGLDNISVFDRSKPLPGGGHIDQSDATAWMAFYCVMMMKIALTLSEEEPVYQDSATKFFEHFQRISTAMADYKRGNHGLWDEDDGFFYDLLHFPDGRTVPLKVRSIVGLLPLFAVETLEPESFKKVPLFEKRLEWFTNWHTALSKTMSCFYDPGVGKRRQMSILTKDRIEKVLSYLLDENEFLSDYGIRSLSKFHKNNPYTMQAEGVNYTVNYQPGESESGLFGGNSNWRGPIWMPVNFLIVGSLQRIHTYYGDNLKIEFPTGSGNKMNLAEIAEEISKRIEKIYLKDKDGRRPVYGKNLKFQTDPHWKDYFLFFEYFNGDTGAGLGASHQTGWTANIINLIGMRGLKNYGYKQKKIVAGPCTT